MSGFLAALSLWSVIPCGPIDEAPYQDATPDGVEFCKLMETAYLSLESQAFGDAYLSAVAADHVMKFEWETQTPLLIMAEAACLDQKFNLGRRHIDSFLCSADIRTHKFMIPGWHNQDQSDVKRQLRAQFSYAQGWRADIQICYSALDGGFPSDFDQSTPDEQNALYQQAYRIKDLGTPQDN